MIIFIRFVLLELNNYLPRIKETVMGKLFINMLQIGDRSEEAKKVLNFKDPKNNFRGQNSDFASVLHTVIANRFVCRISAFYILYLVY